MQTSNKNVYLIGYRATGKTTVGKTLAKRMNRAFVDADDALEKEQGRTISQIVESGGWEEFRSLEKDVLERLSDFESYVIAPGGGAVLDSDNVRCMKETGLVVWLTAAPETICKRLACDEKTSDQRPALTDQGVLEEVASVLNLRTPLYKDAADIIVSTDNNKVNMVCEMIIENMN